MSSSWGFGFLLRLICLAIVTKWASPQVLSVELMGEPGAGCFGGEICRNTPSIGILVDGSLGVDLVGYYVKARLSRTPTSRELMFIGDPAVGGCPTPENCGTPVGVSGVRYEVVNGVGLVEKDCELGGRMMKRASLEDELKVCFGLWDP